MTNAPKSSPAENPYPASDALRHALWEQHIKTDIDAFIAGDWSRVAADFDAARFCALDAGRSADPADWTVGFPTLEAYKNTWLAQSKVTKERADPALLRDALLAGASLAKVTQTGPDALVMLKSFDGALPLKDGTFEPYGWQSLFTLRLVQQDWKIVSFIGYLPPAIP